MHWALLLVALLPATAAQRPNLVNARIHVPAMGGNGHTISLDGRLIIKKNRNATGAVFWKAQVLRPEKIDYDYDGKPSFVGVFSQGKGDVVHNGENALAMCFSDSEHPYNMDDSGNAVYDPFVFDSPMSTKYQFFRHFRRRRINVVVQDPFTEQADVSEFDAGGEEIEYLTTVEGTPVMGIEPTISADGKLMLFQGNRANSGSIDYLMYTYNPHPCAAHGWSVPLPIHRMHSDPNTDLQNYPMAWKELKTAAGELCTDSAPLLGAYPWMDPEGRFVLYMGVRITGIGIREAVSLIGADTHWTAYNIDGGINSMRFGFRKLFYSSPMWNLEKEQHRVQNHESTSNEEHYLPVTKTHDVLPFLGSNTRDYTEVDVGEITDPFYILYLPMNEMVTAKGRYDLTRTPDLSGYFSTGELYGDAYTTVDTSMASSAFALTHVIPDYYFYQYEDGDTILNSTSDWLSTGPLQETYSKGRVLMLNGQGGLRSTLARDTPGIATSLTGFSFQMNIRPDIQVSDECSSETHRYLMHIPSVMTMVYNMNDTVELFFKTGEKWISFGESGVLPRAKWSHVAYSWDGVSGKFLEYIDGKGSGRGFPTIIGPLNLGSAGQQIFIGSRSPSTEDDPQSCGPFVGAIDEVRLYSHARSGRSICLSTFGTDCLKSAIQDVPTSGQNILSHQQPECNSRESISSTACQSAIHRVCSQRGAANALSTTSNLIGTVQQLITHRPPISLGGVVKDESNGKVTVACAPLPQDSAAVTFEELALRHGGCKHDLHAQSHGCTAASHRFCRDIGWDTALIFEVTTRAWVLCFNANLIEWVETSALGTECGPGLWSDGECKLKASKWCQRLGYDAGLVQKVNENAATAKVHCFNGYMVEDFRFVAG